MSRAAALAQQDRNACGSASMWQAPIAGSIWFTRPGRAPRTKRRERDQRRIDPLMSYSGLFDIAACCSADYVPGSGAIFNYYIDLAARSSPIRTCFTGWLHAYGRRLEH